MNEDLQKLSGPKTVLALLLSVGWFIVPATAAGFAVQSSLPLWAKVLVTLVLAPMAGHGLHLMAFVGHEGIHFNLHRNKYVSTALAVMVSGWVPTYQVMGYSMVHWHHHAKANTEADPDVRLYSFSTTFWDRFLRARSRGTRHYLKMTWGAAWGGSTEGWLFPLPAPAIRLFCRLNLCVGLATTLVCLLVLVKSPAVGLVSILLPSWFAQGCSGIRVFMEHAGLSPGKHQDTRSYVHPVFTALFLGGNFHLEHHLSPRVPSYNLPKLHRRLIREGVIALDSPQVERAFWKAFRFSFKQFQLGPGASP